MSKLFITNSPEQGAAKRQQTQAQNTEKSVWVAASAGAGKTRVLTARILRLLLEGAHPASILALTYTRAAAKEMSGRLIEHARALALSDPQSQMAQVRSLLDLAQTDTPLPEVLQRAQSLYERILDTPGGLQIQTIHAFCQSLLGRFPFEAGLTPGFKAVEEEERNQILSIALEKVLGNRPQKFPRLKATIQREGIRDLAQALIKIDWQNFTISDRLSAFDQHLGGGHEGETAADVHMQFCEEMQSRASAAHQLILRAQKTGTSTDLNFATALEAALSAPNPLDILGAACLTKGRIKQRGLCTAALRDEPLVTWLSQVLPLRMARLQSQILYDLNVDVLAFGVELSKTFAEEKARRGALDFDDLIAYAQQLLSQDSGPTYVQYRLDQRIDHILLDEAQDTTANQWQVIAALAEPFFDDASAMIDRHRTLFVVGDFKQSIYSFQGANPQLFEGMYTRFRALAGKTLMPVSMVHSFRSAPAILDFVDHLATQMREGGLHLGLNHPPQHRAVQQGRAGLVQLWPVPKARPDPLTPDWLPPSQAQEPVVQPRAHLGQVIARHIHRLCLDPTWQDRPEAYLSLGRRICPGDFLVLVQNRRSDFANALIGELKILGVPVTGVDRLELNQELVVQDLLALGEVCLQPHDDLALAALLKSPLYGLCEGEIFELAHGRGKSSLRSQLRLKRPDLGEHFNQLANRIGHLSVYDFFATFLFSDGYRARLLDHVGPEAEEVISLFLDRARLFDQQRNGDLLGFIESQRSSEQELKRDTSKSEGQVRLMTVHGAKGLEAPIVILPDLRDPRYANASRADDQLVPLGPTGPVWVPASQFDIPQTQEVKAMGHTHREAERERLFYVALTRAEERLIICTDASRDDQSERGQTTWYNLAARAAKDIGVARDLELEALGWSSDGEGVEVGTLPLSGPAQDTKPSQPKDQPLPTWARQKLAPPLAAQSPLRPSSLLTQEVHDAILPPSARAQSLLRGTLVHAALEHLPGSDPATWAHRLNLFFAAKAPLVPLQDRESWAAEVATALQNPDLAVFFGPHSQAEVSLSGEIDGQGAVGKIDRLSIDASAKIIRILDYKTNRPPPLSAQNVSPAYRAQMRAYAHMLKPLYPEFEIRTYLFWTHTACLMDVTDL